MSENLGQLNKAIQEYQEIMLCQRRLKTVDQELHEQEIKLTRLKQQVEKEHQDVLKLESLTLKQLFSTLLLDKEAQLEKERQEYLLAALNLNETIKLIDLLEYEKKIILQKLKTEKQAHEMLDNALDDFKLSDNSLVTKDYILLKTINQEVKNIIDLKTEANEAVDVIQELKTSFEEIMKGLESATIYDEWGYFYKDRQKAKNKKKQYIDQAQAQVYVVRKLLIFLQAELVDVEEFRGLFQEAHDLLEQFNIGYYNDLISDWIKVLKLNETIEHTLTALGTVAKIEIQLNQLIKKTDQEFQILMIKRSTLIQQITP